MHKSFIVVKEIKSNGDAIPVGTEILIANNIIFVNGYQIVPDLYQMFYSLIQSELKSPYYLKEVRIPYNKC